MNKCLDKIRKYIDFGEFSNLYVYILYSIVSKSLSHFILSLYSITGNDKYSLFGFQTKLNGHILIQSFYKYLSFIIFGMIFYHFSTTKEINKQNNNNIEKENNSRTALGTQNVLIFNKKSLISNISRFDFLIVCIIYVVYLELINLTYNLGFHKLDLWPFNIVFAALFMQIILKKKIYIHQICSLGFIFVVNITIIIIVAFKTSESNVFENTEKMLGSQFLSIPIYLIYIGNSFLISYARIAGKSLMELNFISPYKIIFFIGIIGLILTSIFLLVCEFYNIDTTTTDLFEKNVSLNTEIKHESFDSFSKYFSDLKKSNRAKFWAEIFVTTPANFIFIFMEFQYEILLIYYLNPIYILVSDCIYYGTIASLLYIYKKSNKKDSGNAYLDVISDGLAFLGYLIYLEIIEIKIFNLNKNIRREISYRGNMDMLLKDIEELEEIKRDDDDNDEDEEDNN